MAQTATAGDEAWRRKYFDSLTELERKEQQWSELEGLLRRSISRLTLIGDGLDQQLDLHLERLRNSIRTESDRQRIQNLVEGIVERAARIQDGGVAPGAQQSSAVPATALLAQLLDGLTLPAHCADRAHALRARLDSADPASLVTDFCKLIAAALDAGSAPADATGPVLLRLLGRLSLPALLSGDIEALRGRIAAARRQPVFEQLAEDLAQLVNRYVAGPHSPRATAPIAPERLLGTLLDAIDLPGEMAARVDALREQLAAGPTAQQLDQAVQAIAALVGELRRKVQQERRETEKFLKQLTEHLQELDQGLRGADRDRIESLNSSRVMREAVDAQMQGLEQSMEQARELEQLKTAARDRLTAIREHLVEHRRDEEHRSRQAQEQIAQLTGRVSEMEAETAGLRERVEQARRQALRDPLTGLYNRLAFDERMALEYTRWQRYPSAVAMVIWDLDHFKQINDGFGHKAGDKVLAAVGRMLATALRNADFTARYGGEEFVTLMPETTLADAMAVADKFRQRVATTGFHHSGKKVPVTISCGVASFSAGDTPESVFERMDKALYRAKEAGRNRCEAGTE